MGDTIVKIPSNLYRSDGARAIFDIQLSAAGTPKGLIFWDIDKTLVDLDSVYIPIREAMWPDAVARDGMAEVGRVHEAGFKLGTMWRELYRMYAIYELDKSAWKDPAVYEAEFLAPGKPGEHIDETGDEYHEFSDKLLRKFDDVAVVAVEREYKRDHDLPEKYSIKPAIALAERYRREGVPMVGMSANPRGFIRSVCTYTGLADFLIDCASDDDALGRKEWKMQYLIGVLESKGLHIPYQNLTIIGDSLEGDIGSGPRLAKLMESRGIKVAMRGVLVVADKNEAKWAEQMTAERAELRGLVEVLVIGD